MARLLMLKFAFALAVLCLISPNLVLAEESSTTIAGIVRTPSETGSEENTNNPSPDNPRRLRIGLALGGGGGRGAAHVGVLKVLAEEKVPIDFICGTSVGSVIGGLYASGVPLSKIEAMVREKQIMRAYYSMPIPLRFTLLPFDFIPRGCGFHGLVGLNTGNKFSRFLDENLPQGVSKIEDTPVPFSCVTTDMINGEPYVMSTGSLSKALQASSAVPFLKKPVKLEGKYLADGFICGSNLPIRECRAMGADLVICVNIDGPVKSAADKVMHHNRPYRHQLANIVLNTFDAERAREADLLISPDVSKMRMLTYSRKDAAGAMNAGEKAAREALPQIKALVERATNGQRQAQIPSVIK